MNRSEHGGASPTARRAERAAIVLCVQFLFLTFTFGQSNQDPSSSTSKKRLFIDAFEGKLGSAQLRDKVAARLRGDRNWRVVESPSEADAIVDGAGAIWIKGYVSNSPHASATWREPVYSGYLSLSVKDKRGETLWSYLVTPGRMHWNGVDQDMANHIVRLMDAALAGSYLRSELPTTKPSTQISIAGAGSTFAGPLYQEWIQSFQEEHPEIRASYEPVGSERGLDDLKASKVDFAASDVPVSGELGTSLPVKVHQYATVLGGVVVAYNLPGVGPDLRLTPEVLAAIYMGKISRWSDEELRELNRGTRLPDEPIMVIHRSDGSGTSFAWTQFLSKTNAEWKRSVGSGMRVSWPTGDAEEGNEGVAAKIGATPGSIGYVELTYAIRHQLSFALIRNAAGKFVQANLATLGAAIKSPFLNGDLTRSLINPPRSDAYPIVTFTWVLLPESVENPQKSSILRDFVRWMLTSGQKECAGLGYLPLPKEIADSEVRQVSAARP